MSSEASPEPKLSLFSLPSQPPEPPGTLTPPLLTSVSVPFQWEEAPGKPRHCGGGTEPKAKCARSLELPPRSPSKEIKGGGSGFGSMRWTGFWKNKEAVDGNFDFSPTKTGGGDQTKVKITRIRRKDSFFNSASHTRHVWASIYESLKQVVPWRRRREKLRKSATVGYEPETCDPIPTC
ncbi:hypothetical protein M0R45_038221 [Rubus argutus]|uniref:Uncharacterized protein n=1 Tax=Rubus argutus TaxID=59490 RepID=A0AAW1W4F4_RUBAR